MTDRPETRQSGFTLIELSIVLVVIGMVVAMFSHIGVGYLESKQREATNLKLDAIEEALVRFVAATRRLPCPAAIAGSGVEDRDAAAGACNDSGANADQKQGIVPWVTLGLSEAAVIDGWNNRFTFRVAPALVADDAMNMNGCRAWGTRGANPNPGGACIPGGGTTPADYTSPRNFLLTKGLLVADDSSGTEVAINNPYPSTATETPTGAAYFLVSHGKDGFGAYPGRGTTRRAITGAGDKEQQNVNDVTVLIPASLDYDFAYYDRRIVSATTNHFDDHTRHRTVLDMAVRAGLGPGQ